MKNKKRIKQLEEDVNFILNYLKANRKCELR